MAVVIREKWMCEEYPSDCPKKGIRWVEPSGWWCEPYTWQGGYAGLHTTDGDRLWAFDEFWDWVDKYDAVPLDGGAP